MKAVLLAFWVVFFASIAASVVLQAGFRRSLRREAPDLHRELWDPKRRSPQVRARMMLPFVGMIFFRRYRTVLAAYPVSRAWASWMFANNWLQVALVAMLIAVTWGK